MDKKDKQLSPSDELAKYVLNVIQGVVISGGIYFLITLLAGCSGAPIKAAGAAQQTEQMKPGENVVIDGNVYCGRPQDCESRFPAASAPYVKGEAWNGQ